MARSKCCTWFLHCCCCCCKCCCEDSEATVHTPLLKRLSQTPPPQKDGISDLQVKEEGGEETQLMKVVVTPEPAVGEKTPDISDTEKEDKEDTPPPVLRKKEDHTPANPSERSRPESGVFVRGTGSRSSWRVVPSVTQQVKEANKETSKEKEATPKTTPTHTPPENGAVASESTPPAQRKEPYRNFVLLPQEVEDENSVEVEIPSVTMTFTIADTQHSSTDDQEQSTKTTPPPNGQESQVRDRDTSDPSTQ